MTPTDALDRLLVNRMLVLIRASGLTAADRSDYVDAGLASVEISFAAPDAPDSIRAWRAERPEMLVGAGTVRTEDEAEAAIRAGAQYLVSPGLDPKIVRLARDADILHVPGVFTPTEVGAALDAGAPLLKLFPAGRLGEGYVRDLLAPFPGTRFLVTGGVTPESAAGFLAAGARVVGFGGSFSAPGDDRPAFRERLRHLVDHVSRCAGELESEVAA